MHPTLRGFVANDYPRPSVGSVLIVLALLLALAAPAGAQSGATFRGSVVAASTGAPIAGAVVLFPDLARETRTDARGEFRMEALAPGVHRVRVEGPGHVAAEATVELSAGPPAEYVFELQPEPVRLEELTVTGASVPRNLGEFERRRMSHQGGGRFLLRPQLAARENSRLSDVLRSMPGVRIVYDGEKSMVASGRAQPPGALRGGPPRPCLAQVFVDGVRVFAQGSGAQPDSPPLDVNVFQVRDMEAVEYYANISSTPPEMRTANANCGTLVLWTRQ